MTNNSQNHKSDPHYIKAKKKGYRARSAYKLMDINKKFNIFKRAFYILDIGAAPGSWLQVAQEIAEENLIKYQDNYYHRGEYKILGIDLKHISSIDKVKTIKIDFRDPKVEDYIKDYFKDELDLILSDVSINKSGNNFSDHIKQIKLGYDVLKLAKNNLKNYGNIVIKCFQGEDFKKFYDDFKKLFKFAKAYKPKASKKQSNEIYLIGIKMK